MGDNGPDLYQHYVFLFDTLYSIIDKSHLKTKIKKDQKCFKWVLVLLRKRERT